MGTVRRLCTAQDEDKRMEYRFRVTEQQDGRSLGSFLRTTAQLSASLLRSLKQTEGGIAVDGVPSKTDRRVWAGETVVIRMREDERLLSPYRVFVPMPYESECLVLYDKPAGMATHPTLNHPDGTLANVYAAHCLDGGLTGGSFRPINRLDKNTSGLVLAAKDRYAAARLSGAVHKSYLAVAEGDIAQDGIIDRPIGREDSSIIRRCVREDGQPSVTEYTVLARGGGHSLLNIVTRTGRTHQIRVHLASVGHPLAGDDLYGGSTGHIARHALHCASMAFRDPLHGRVYAFRSGLPEDMLKLVERLGLK